MQFFNYDGTLIRVLQHDGQRYFFAKDIANVLKYTQTNGVTRLLPREWVDKIQTNEAIISEQAVWYVLVRSTRTIAAQEFMRWLSRPIKQSTSDAQMVYNILIRYGNKLTQCQIRDCVTKILKDAELERTYSATDISEVIGVTPIEVGRIANIYGLKHKKDYARWTTARSRETGSSYKQCRYTKKALDWFKKHRKELYAW